MMPMSRSSKMCRAQVLVAALAVAACSSRGGPAAPGSPHPGTSSAAGDTSTAPEAAANSPRPPALRLPATARPLRQAVDLTVIPEQDTFAGSTQIDVELTEATSVLWLNAKKIEVREASIESRGTTQPAVRLATSNEEFLGLSVPRPVGPGPAILRISYHGKLVDDDYVGLFRQREAGTAYVFSQFEIADARRAFPCFDEPSFKIPWQLTLRIEKDHVGLANSPVARETPGPGEKMKTIEFLPTQPLSSYLIAIAVGPFDMVSAGRGGRKNVPLRIAVTRGRAADARVARRTTREFLVKLEKFFGTPYPFEKLDSVSVPHFFGAMENAALITYGANILLATPAEEKTPDFQISHRETVAHEIAHQWFGDLVTMAWWDDLWLNESFATWLERKLTHPGLSDPDMSFGPTGREGALREDSLPSTRAIHQPIASNDDFLFLFNALNYGKGAAVIAMFERWVGEEKFRDGVRAYMRKHEHRNATTADFLAALDQAAPGRDVASAFATFLQQPGVPMVSIELRCSQGEKPALELRQERLLWSAGNARPAGSQLWKIPVCVEYGTGKRAAGQCTLLDQPSETLALEAKSCPTWVNGNTDALGYYRVFYAGELLARALDDRTPLTTRERASVLEDAVALADAGRMSYGVLVAALPSLARVRNFAVLRRVANLARAIEDLVPPERRDAYATLVRELFAPRARAVGWKPRPGESVAVRQARPVLLTLVADQGRDPAIAAEAERLARAWLRDPSSLPPDAAGSVLGAAAAARGGSDLYDAYLARLRQEKGLERRGLLLAGLARFRDPSLVARTVELAASAEIPFNEVGSLLSGGLADPALAEQVYDAVVKQFPALVEKLGADRRIQLLSVGGALCTRQLRDRADRFFADKLARAPGIAIARGKMRESIELCAARRAAQSAAVADALKGS
jgi:cytosol alanyl aminopeptidase